MKYKNFVFDFDGVLPESNKIRFIGFRHLFQGLPRHQMDELVAYAKASRSFIMIVDRIFIRLIHLEPARISI
jgi:phosphoglycolate phosphatase-like HAD superfamily hydrolase